MMIQSIIRRSFWEVSGLVACIALLLLVGCGGSAPAQPTATISAAAATQPEATTSGPDPDETAVPTPDARPTQPEAAGTVSLEIGTAAGAKEFKYSKDTLEAPAGSKIKLKFTNNTNSKDEVGHNWVLVKPGQEDSVLANAAAAGDNKDWLKEDDPGIIANTKLIEGGQSVTIRFDAPPPGTYTYLCTFPDHYAGGMKGILTIR